MIKILNPQSHHSNSTTVKTAEIMSKYRPIAPRPETPLHDDHDHDHDSSSSSSMSNKITQSPYLRSLWPQLQARPTRTRKRGRLGMTSPPLGLRRPRTTAAATANTTPAEHVLGFSAFPRLIPSLAQVGCALEIAGSSGLVTLPLLQCCSSIATGPEFKCMDTKGDENVVIDLNKAAEAIEERDFLQQLQGPITITTATAVIAPQPIRPVGSSITVACINREANSVTTDKIPSKKSEEIEEEVESDKLPAVISDSNNRVRLVNSAYSELVGQPECSWLGSMVNGRTGGKRICGEVLLHLCESQVLNTAGRFTCWVRIEWGSEDQKKKKKNLHAFCDVIRLACWSKDYLFTWRFHTNGRDVSQSSCTA